MAVNWYSYEDGKTGKENKIYRKVYRIHVFHIRGVECGSQQDNPATLRSLYTTAGRLVRSGGWGRVAYLRLSPSVAAALIREGGLTPHHVAKSTQTHDTIRTRMDLVVEGGSLPVIVLIESYGDQRIPSPGFVFVDSSGQSADS